MVKSAKNRAALNAHSKISRYKSFPNSKRAGFTPQLFVLEPNVKKKSERGGCQVERQREKQRIAPRVAKIGPVMAKIDPNP